MSSEQEEERREYVERDPGLVYPATSQPTVVTGLMVQERIVRQPMQTVAPVVATAPPGAERRESVVVRRDTNVGAIIAMVVGAIILLFGIVLVFTKVFPYLAYPWSLIAVLVVAVVMIAVGGSLMQTRNSRV